MRPQLFGRPRAGRPSPACLRLTALEDRTVPSTTTAITESDPSRTAPIHVDPNVMVEEQAGTALVTVLAANQPAIRLNPFPDFEGPINIAIGDVNGDGRKDVVIGAGPGGGPHVKAFDAATGTLLSSFFAYDPSFRGGVHVDAGDVDGNGVDEIVTGAGFGGGPHVRALRADGTEVLSVFTFEPAFRGGVSVAAFDTNGNGRAEIITAAGPGGGPRVSVFDALTRTEVASIFAFAPSYTGGVNLRSIGQADGSILLEASPATTDGVDPVILPFSRLMDMSTMVPPSTGDDGGNGGTGTDDGGTGNGGTDGGTGNGGIDDGGTDDGIDDGTTDPVAV